METKVCSCCGQEKSIEEFYPKHSQCKECIRKKANKKYHSKKDAQPKEGLANYTPRELLEELGRRGYNIEATYVQTLTVKAGVGIVKTPPRQ